MRVALVGAGHVGERHAQSLARMPGVTFAGVASGRPENARSLAGRFDVPAYDGVADLLKHSGAEAVVLATPTHLHRLHIEQAAAAGVHVICEKPLAPTLADARAAAAACRLAGVQLHVGHVLRWFPDYTAARAAVLAGHVGRPGVVRLSRNSYFPSGRGDWFANLEQSGGVLLDLLVHDFDWLRWTFGPVERVFAKALAARDDRPERLDYALVTLRFKQGTIAHVEGAWAHDNFHTRLEIAGTKGVLVYNSEDVRPFALTLRHTEERPGVAIPETPMSESPYYRELEHFIRCMRGETEPLVTVADAIGALVLALAAQESAHSGQPVTPQECEEGEAG